MIIKIIYTQSIVHKMTILQYILMPTIYCSIIISMINLWDSKKIQLYHLMNQDN